MTTLIIPLVLLALAAVLIVLISVHEKRKPEEWDPPSEFEMYQRRARAARARAEWRQQQRTIDNERENL
jgi:hypothetical protein